MYGFSDIYGAGQGLRTFSADSIAEEAVREMFGFRGPRRFGPGMGPRRFGPGPGPGPGPGSRHRFGPRPFPRHRFHPRPWWGPSYGPWWWASSWPVGVPVQDPDLAFDEEAIEDRQEELLTLVGAWREADRSGRKAAARRLEGRIVRLVSELRAMDPSWEAPEIVLGAMAEFSTPTYGADEPEEESEEAERPDPYGDWIEGIGRQVTEDLTSSGFLTP